MKRASQTLSAPLNILVAFLDDPHTSVDTTSTTFVRLVTIYIHSVD